MTYDMTDLKQGGNSTRFGAWKEYMIKSYD